MLFGCVRVLIPSRAVSRLPGQSLRGGGYDIVYLCLWPMLVRVTVLYSWKGSHTGHLKPQQSIQQSIQPRHHSRSPVDEVHSLLFDRIGIPSELLPKI